MSTNKLREELTKSFLAVLNEGDIPWEASWKVMRPENAITGKRYRGVNAIWLSFLSSFKGYSDPRWCTFKQAADKGWKIKKGAKSTFVEFWSLYDKKTKKYIEQREADRIIEKDPDRKKDIFLTSRTYCVFNGDQIEGIPELPLVSTVDIQEVRAKRDVLLSNMDLDFREGGDRAFYSPAWDRVSLPPEKFFNDTYGYMATFLHECGHATGHESRLNRDLSGRFGSESYAKEELRAEIASAFTAQALGLGDYNSGRVGDVENHRAYVQHWAKVIQFDPNELFAAIRDAESISDYLLEKGEFLREIDVKEVDNQRKPSLDSQIKAASSKAVELGMNSRGNDLVSAKNNEVMI